MIGWYVHHHGAGHVTRARAVAKHLNTAVTALSSLDRPDDWPGQWVQLARDDSSAAPEDVTAGGTLHWAPRHDPGLLDRTAAIVAWVRSARPSLVVVDVSVEVALAVRLCGIPVVVAAMPGDRTDRAHATAYDLADHLLAPWPAGVHSSGWPGAWVDKTWYVGGLSRFGGAARSIEAADPESVLVVFGRGGRHTTDAQVASAARATPGRRWTTIDPTASGDGVWAALLAAGVVVTHAGQNSVAEVAAAGRPAVVVAQPRPHDEQAATAGAVHQLGVAVGLRTWPQDDEWPILLKEAESRAGRWSQWGDDGAERAAAHLDRRVRELTP